MILQKILTINSVQKLISFTLTLSTEIRYTAVKKMNKVSIPTSPMLGSSEIEAISKISSPNKDFLEYGAGGSTAYIAAQSRSLTTVESDAKFLNAVIRKNQEYRNINFLHGDIGPTKSFGQPIILLRWKYQKKWPDYALLPWIADSCPRQYSSIFIDGRFRVACALVTLIHNPIEDYEILIDDYFLRTEYFVVEKILGSPTRVGNAALFSVRKSEIDLKEIEELLDSYKYDFR
jgi:hypothetical protein